MPSYLKEYILKIIKTSVKLFSRLKPYRFWNVLYFSIAKGFKLKLHILTQ